MIKTKTKPPLLQRYHQVIFNVRIHNIQLIITIRCRTTGCNEISKHSRRFVATNSDLYINRRRMTPMELPLKKSLKIALDDLEDENLATLSSISPGNLKVTPSPSTTTSNSQSSGFPEWRFNQNQVRTSPDRQQWLFRSWLHFASHLYSCLEYTTTTRDIFPTHDFFHWLHWDNIIRLPSRSNLKKLT